MLAVHKFIEQGGAPRFDARERRDHPQPTGFSRPNLTNLERAREMILSAFPAGVRGDVRVSRDGSASSANGGRELVTFQVTIYCLELGLSLHDLPPQKSLDVAVGEAQRVIQAKAAERLRQRSPAG